MRGLLRACHPGPTVVVTAVAVMLGAGFGLDAGVLTLIGATVLMGQLSIGWSNDWLDAERDTAARREDKPTATGGVSVTTVRTAAVTFGALSIPASLAWGWRPGTCHLVLVASGWLYNLGLKRSLLSPLPYLLGFGALPAYVALVADIDPQWWLVTAGALLGLSAHFANAAPDVITDRALGVWGAPQRLGTRVSLGISLVVLAAAGVLAISQLEAGTEVALAAVLLPTALGLAVVLRGSVKAVFPLVMCAALIDVGMLIVVA
ncbi:MAG TPA: UbiA family prenyltransferase [Actinomycetes bacterium]|nr:UbiA family prenyltransferase [Actinomycetes bacterium]